MTVKAVWHIVKESARSIGVRTICGAMPNPGLCRMLAPWQQPELFLSKVIRHSLAPAEDQNTEQTAIRFAKHTSP